MIDDQFARCWPWLEPALAEAGNTHTRDQLLAAIQRGEAVLWPGERSAAVTEFYTTPRTKALNFWLLGGDLRDLLSMLPAIEAWARSQGCSHAIGAGRAAWARPLRAYGYSPVHTTFEKEL